MFDHSDGHVCLKQSPVCLFALIAVALSFGPARGTSVCHASDHASSTVQRALRSELGLDADRRKALLDAALKQDPNLAEAHWARGEVRVRGQWLSLMDSAADALSRSNLQKYQERRESAENTVRGHIRLAEFCHSNALPAQERAHWTAVIALEPNHLEARRRLGQVIVDGNWLDRHEVEKQKKTELATGAYLQKHGNRLTALSIAIQDQSMTVEDVTKKAGSIPKPLGHTWTRISFLTIRRIRRPLYR